MKPTYFLAGFLAFVFAAGSAAAAEVYRCGSAYSTTPCEGAQIIKTAPAKSGPKTMVTSTATLSLCQGAVGSKFWTREPCPQLKAVTERTELVPADMPLNEQIFVAREKPIQNEALAEAFADSGSNPANPPAKAAQCLGLAARVDALDHQRRGGGSAVLLEWIAGERKQVRDRQVRLRC